MGILNSRLLLPLSTMAIAVALAAGATIAYFSDLETSANNSLTAGEVDLQIDNTSYINGSLNPDTTWVLDDLTDQLFFNFTDVKPSDIGEDTISLHVESNPCWLCAQITLTKNDDTSCNEPENIDDPTCGSPSPEPDGDLLDGELGSQVNFIFWTDDGDNVLEEGEQIIKQGDAQDALDESIVLADSTTSNLLGVADGQPMQPGTDYFIGKAWCFGTLTPAPLPQDGFTDQISPATTTGGVSCDGSGLNNAAQTDTLMADIAFSAVQSRNNPDFICPQGSPTPTPTESPSPGPCDLAPDVMLVLDRSSSINSSELTQLKGAANDFVTALTPSADTAHVGLVSFSTNSTLNVHLTSDGSAVQTAINGLVSSGLTNLQSAIDNAQAELGGGDGHDRDDTPSPDYMVIITDGNPNEPGSDANAEAVAAAAATAAKNAGTTIYVVGVGSDVEAIYLQDNIASSPAHYFSVADFGDLSAILNQIAVCPQNNGN